VGRPVAIVTGGNRGIGLAIVAKLARCGYQVFLGARDIDTGEVEAEALRRTGLSVVAAKLDVTDAGCVSDFFRSLDRVDALVNCAGVYVDVGLGFSEISEEMLRSSIEVNVIGAWRMCREVSSFMIQRGFGRIVNVSSGWASLQAMQGNAAAYRISKAALNALTCVVAAELEKSGDIKVNSVCPGWVRTRMGGDGGELSPDEAAEDVVWPIFFGEDGPTGKFFRRRQSLDW
jgi:NAD(P)-dependent dehydrogenase (short-subunit alcohol dehydrogenase family)